MPSIGHVAVGLAAGRLYRGRGATALALARSMVGFSAVSLLPDVDAVAFRLGIPYAHPFGHRGATHSLGFAVLAGAVAFLAAKASKLEPRRVALFTLVVVASHPLLDMLTDGGLGCALFWPASNQRLFFPMTPIPVAPIGLGMLSARGLRVVLAETAMFLPLMLYALWPRVPAPATNLKV